MSNYNKNLTPEQLEIVGKFLYLIQELFETGNAQKLADLFGTSPQRLQYHANKHKKEANK